jgi:hypothetical protein
MPYRYIMDFGPNECMDQEYCAWVEKEDWVCDQITELEIASFNVIY